MQYVLAFLEGIVTFLSPCLLPMLPIYAGYFMGVEDGVGARRHGLRRAVGFVLGFTALFVLMGAFAGTLGGFLVRYAAAVNLFGGGVIALLGLSCLGVFRLPAFGGVRGGWRAGGFWVSLLMGMIFALGWTPCVGVFLGSALVLAAQSGGALRGAAMLLAYSLGLGVPFVLGALLLERMKTAFDWMNRHSAALTRLSGGLLLAFGVLMMTGLLGKLLSLMA